MATNKTSFLNLNDWVGTDQFRREEINENFRALDAKAKEHNDSINEHATKLGDIGTLANLTTANKTNLVAAVNENVSQLADITQQQSGIYNVKSFKCDDGQYVKGDGTHDDTTGIQRALDNAEGTLYFPQGNYKITSGLTLTKKLNLVGSDPNRSKIRGDFLGATVDILTINFSNNYGFLDVRNWKIESLGIAQNGGGRHAINIPSTGFQILSSSIENCNLGGTPANGGYSIYIDSNFAHGRIAGNTISTELYLKCYDANLIEKNTFLGTRVAITFDLILGVRNNTVRDNTIVNRDGAVHIKNGDIIRIVNNQIELAQGQGASQSPTRSMIWVQGIDRSCENVIISENNFGGGTSLDHLIYVDNAYKTIIDRNNFVATNIAEVLFTANAKYCILKQDNVTKTQDLNTRTRTFLKAKVVDSGVGNVGVLKDATALNLQNGWTMSAGDGFYKDECGLVHFTGRFNAGTNAAGTLIGTLPLGFRPIYFCNILCATASGTGRLILNTNGQITIGSIPTNADVLPNSFVTATTE